MLSLRTEYIKKSPNIWQIYFIIYNMLYLFYDIYFMLNSLVPGHNPNIQLPVHSIQKNLLDNLQNKKKPSSKLSQHNQSEAIIDTLNTSVPTKKPQNRGQFWHLKDKDLQAWKEEYNLHPEWQWLSTTEIREEKESWWYAFYIAFNKWKNGQTKDKDERERLKNEIFPDKSKKCYYRFQNNVLKFDSYPERKCALILYNLGMINDFVEWKNFHVLTYVGPENKDSASVDFRIWSVFLEYHTGWRWKKFIDEAQRKHENITTTKYQGITELYVFDNIYNLYDIIKKDKILIKHIPQNKLIYLSHPDEFKRLVYTVCKQLEEYDSINLDQLPQAA